MFRRPFGFHGGFHGGRFGFGPGRFGFGGGFFPGAGFGFFPGAAFAGGLLAGSLINRPFWPYGPYGYPFF